MDSFNHNTEMPSAFSVFFWLKGGYPEIPTGKVEAAKSALIGKEQRMYTNLFLLNKLPNVDIAFFLVCLGIVLLIVAIYFLIPVFRKSQYEERRESLRQREAAFKKGRAEALGTTGVADQKVTADEAAHEEPTSEETKATEK